MIVNTVWNFRNFMKSLIKFLNFMNTHMFAAFPPMHGLNFVRKSERPQRLKLKILTGAEVFSQDQIKMGTNLHRLI